MVFEVGDMQFVEIGKLSVDRSVQESECFEEEFGVYVHSLIGSTPLNTIKINGFLFDPSIVFKEDWSIATNTKTLLGFDIDDFVELLSMFRGFFTSIESTSSFTFDPGQRDKSLVDSLDLFAEYMGYVGLEIIIMMPFNRGKKCKFNNSVLQVRGNVVDW